MQIVKVRFPAADLSREMNGLIATGTSRRSSIAIMTALTSFCRLSSCLMRRLRRSRNALAVKTGRGHPLRTARSGSPRRRRAPAPPRTASLPAPPLRPAANRSRPPRMVTVKAPSHRSRRCRGWRSARRISGSTISSALELRDRHCGVIPEGPASCRAPVHLRTAEAASAQLRVGIAIPPRGLGRCLT